MWSTFSWAYWLCVHFLGKNVCSDPWLQEMLRHPFENCPLFCSIWFCGNPEWWALLASGSGGFEGPPLWQQPQKLGCWMCGWALSGKKMKPWFQQARERMWGSATGLLKSQTLRQQLVKYAANAFQGKRRSGAFLLVPLHRVLGSAPWRCSQAHGQPFLLVCRGPVGLLTSTLVGF